VPPLQESMRVVRGGSRWLSRGDDREEVVVVWRRQHYVAFVLADDLNTGGLLPIDEFRDEYEWVAGR
jgi:hypothetical protein